MRRHWFLRALMIIPLVILALAVFGLRGYEPVELADAGSFRMEIDQLLASCGPGDSEPDLVRRIPRPSRARQALAVSHDGTLGENDSRRTRKIPRRHAPPLRLS